MIFTHIARVITFLAVIFGALQLAIGFGIATEFFGPYAAALARYAPGAANSGEVINRGTYALLLAVALGTLVEISFNIRRGQK
ncbi:hypothetical protein Rleg4DRAFT_4205 [Rhizobium leguminosarum bv. trifolii WSM2297]|uniref:Uncharacterized protein n=1 Tax=Rhizobium leguminosarum bv. trifolii WSM2297 TaxID=754762 RepID=J0CRW4_RHILT|nr:hypothetical protein [Rhizobium leguminosarum]EJC82490.1 hypothetical protein Rleg4DRAFT_4205 [Rhizobium leguminosarum bv. trifolii WSM2297]